MKIYCGSEYNSASTTTLVKSTRSTLHFFWYRKWPSEASNPQNFPLRGLNEGCALSGARKTFIDLGGGAPKTSIFYENWVKSAIFAGSRWFTPPLRASWTPDLQKSTWCHPWTGRAGAWRLTCPARTGRAGCLPMSACTWVEDSS